MIFRLLIVWVSFLIVPSVAHAQQFDWADGAGGWVDDYSNKTVLDPQGNVYVTGHGSFGTSFGSFTMSSKGFFLVKYGPEGNVLWARFGTKSSSAQESGLALDSQGNIYVSGSYGNSMDLGDTTLIPTSSLAGFLVKYSSSGDLIWATNIGKSINYYFGGGPIAVDQEDNVYVTGGFIDNISFEEDLFLKATFTGYPTESDLYLAKFDKEGKVQWAKSAGTGGEDFTADLQIDNNNQVYWAINTAQEVFYFGDEKYDLPAHGTIILICDPQGEISWHTNFNGNVSSMAVDDDKNLYLTGVFDDVLTLDEGFTLEAETHGSNYVVKYKPDGSIQWAKKILVDGPRSSFIGVNNENIYIGGTFNGYIKTSEDSITGDGGSDIFLIKLNDVGYEQWLKTTGSNSEDYLTSIAVSHQYAIAVTGNYSGTKINFDGLEILNNSGNSDSDIFTALINDTTRLHCPQALLQLTVDNNTICPGEEAILSANEDSDYPIQWYKDGKPNHRSQEKNHEVSVGGVYHYVIYDSTACSVSSNQVNITMIDFPEKTITVKPGLQTCNNQPIRIEVNNDPNYFYQWYENSTLLEEENNYFIYAFKSGNYYCQLINKNKCSIQSDVVSVEILPAEVDFLPDTVYRCQNEAMVLSPGSLNYDNWNFLWSTNDENSELEVVQEGLYSLEVFNGECSYTDHVWVKNYEKLWAPNVITPNGDGLNDSFIIKNSTNPVHLAIYNKWGKLIFENEEYFNSWSAEGLEPGTYYYTIREKAACHQNNFIKGWVDIRH